MNRSQRIENILTQEFNPEILEVINNSNLHSGHLGDDGTGETHYLVKINSSHFNNLNRIEIHKKINKSLQKEFDLGLHALEIKILK